ncbi:MAG: CPBP family intramembrane metalloprotease [Chlamydiales bacterium]|nr:CPBP family intramembrane metalloprotease [Chlamydiales bacterium]
MSNRRQIPIFFTVVVVLSFLMAFFIEEVFIRVLGVGKADLAHLAKLIYICALFAFILFYCLFKDYLSSILFWNQKESFSFYKDLAYASKLFVIGVAILACVNAMVQALGIQIVEQHAVVVVKQQLSMGIKQKLFTVFLVCFFAPVYEEFICRGILQSSWVKSWGRFWGILLASIAFASAHISTFAITELRVLLNLFIFSLFLGWAYEKRKSLLCSVILHIMLNTMTLLALLLFQKDPLP